MYMEKFLFSSLSSIIIFKKNKMKKVTPSKILVKIRK